MIGLERRAYVWDGGPIGEEKMVDTYELIHGVLVKHPHPASQTWRFAGDLSKAYKADREATCAGGCKDGCWAHGPPVIVLYQDESIGRAADSGRGSGWCFGGVKPMQTKASGRLARLRQSRDRLNVVGSNPTRLPHTPLCSASFACTAVCVCSFQTLGQGLMCTAFICDTGLVVFTEAEWKAALAADKELQDCIASRGGVQFFEYGAKKQGYWSSLDLVLQVGGVRVARVFSLACSRIFPLFSSARPTTLHRWGRYSCLSQVRVVMAIMTDGAGGFEAVSRTGSALYDALARA